MLPIRVEDMRRYITVDRELVKLSYGNGCPLCPSCFICPGPAHCIWDKGASKKRREATIRNWEPIFKKELSQEALGGKR